MNDKLNNIYAKQEAIDSLISKMKNKNQLPWKFLEYMLLTLVEHGAEEN